MIHRIAIITLLLIALFIRVHQIGALPIFNDESLHIGRSTIVFHDRATALTAGKVLDYYWLGGFGFDRHHALIGGRLAHALIVLISGAAIYRTGQDFFRAGLFALVVYTFSPYIIFLERMILADQLAAAFGLLTIVSAARLVLHPTRWNGALCGLWIALAVLSKLIAAPLILVPLIAIRLLGRRDYPTRSALLACYMLLIGIGLPFVIFPIWRQLTGDPVLLVGGNLVSLRHLQLDHNLPQVWHVLIGYWGGVTLIVALIALARVRRDRRAMYLLLCTVLLWIVPLCLGVHPSNRYWLPGLLPLIVVVAGGLKAISPQKTLRKAKIETFIFSVCNLPHPLSIQNGEGRKAFPLQSGSRTEFRWGKRVGELGVLYLLFLWIAFFAAPFIWQMWHDPRDLHLSERDRWEYFENYSSGYGVTEAAKYITAQAPMPLVSTVVQCHALPLLLPDSVDLTCPFFGWHGEYLDQVIAHIDQGVREHGTIYLLVEPDAPFVDVGQIRARFDLTLIRRFERPGKHGIAVELYQVRARP